MLIDLNKQNVVHLLMIVCTSMATLFKLPLVTFIIKMFSLLVSRLIFRTLLRSLSKNTYLQTFKATKKICFIHYNCPLIRRIGRIPTPVN